LVPPTKALRRLDQFLREINSQRTAADAATEAIDQWIAIQRGHPVRPNIAPARGYQWKTLFLPEGTELRVTSAAGTSAYARVLGDDIIFGNRRTSPRQLCLATLGAGRNAWRDVWVLLPGQLKWRPASLLRRKANRELEVMPATMSPQEAMAAAARCMSESLQAALALVDHATDQARAAASFPR
jgi:hypothetical protein